MKNILSLDPTSCSGYYSFLFPFTSKLLEKLTCACFSNFLPFISPQPTLVKYLFPITLLKLLLSCSLVTSTLLNPTVYSQTSQHLTCHPHLRQFITPFSLNTFFTWLPGHDASGFLPTSLSCSFSCPLLVLPLFS